MNLIFTPLVHTAHLAPGARSSRLTFLKEDFIVAGGTLLNEDMPMLYINRTVESTIPAHTNNWQGMFQ